MKRFWKSYWNAPGLPRFMIAPFLCLAISGSTPAHQATETTTAEEDVPTADIVIVVGAGGTPEYAEQFSQWADQWNAIAEKSAASVTRIGPPDPSDTPDHQRLEKTIASFAANDRSPIWIVLIGHGTFSQNVAKFNLTGPDVSASEMAEWLAAIKRTVVVVDCASASGPFVNRLSGENRVIVTATKSGSEQNFARFGEFFANAISSADSDLDHDDEVSVQEAFLRASAEVRQFYESQARISTEHALIDDNGDGRGTPAKMFRGTRVIASAKDGATVDGKNASRITLSPAENRLPFTTGELQERSDIERQLDELRRHKEALSENAYDAALEPLLMRLAEIYQAAEQRVEKE